MDSANTETETLPSRRYKCIICGCSGRRGNKPAQRKLEPVCPCCRRDVDMLESMLDYLPKLIKYRQFKNQNQ